MKINETTNAILTERFGKDSLIALAAAENNSPSVRTMDAVYIDFFQAEQQEALIEKIAAGDWSAAKFLAKLLAEDRFHSVLGGGTVYLLMDGEKIVSFVTLTQQDCIADDTLYPWLEFFFTFPEYRGKRCGGKLLAYAAEEARKQGYQQVYLATDHIGLYEKYGFTYLENRIDVYGEDSRIYVKNFGGNL